MDAIFFASNRLNEADMDLFVATRADTAASFEAAEPLVDLNSANKTSIRSSRRTGSSCFLRRLARGRCSFSAPSASAWSAEHPGGFCRRASGRPYVRLA